VRADATEVARFASEQQPLHDLLVKQYTTHIAGSLTAPDTLLIRLCLPHKICAPCLPRLPCRALICAAVPTHTGKYLNVIRGCGQPVPPCPESTLAQLRYDAAAAERGSPPFLAGIQAALSAAAGALLAHMTGPQGRLLSWLHCLKHFFLLDQVCCCGWAGPSRCSVSVGSQGFWHQ
jgi:hypothetical protein